MNWRGDDERGRGGRSVAHLLLLALLLARLLDALEQTPLKLVPAGDLLHLHQLPVAVIIFHGPLRHGEAAHAVAPERIIQRLANLHQSTDVRRVNVGVELDLLGRHRLRRCDAPRRRSRVARLGMTPRAARGKFQPPSPRGHIFSWVGSPRPRVARARGAAARACEVDNLTEFRNVPRLGELVIGSTREVSAGPGASARGTPSRRWRFGSTTRTRTR